MQYDELITNNFLKHTQGHFHQNKKVEFLSLDF